jgi:succinate dehydrogenase/fumarate reductase flavoprotein subunit
VSDTEVDVLVVGSGAAGMATALTASIEGLEVLLVEKTDRIGGSTAISGGGIWVPNNDKTDASGHPDSLAEAKAYLDRIVGNWSSDEMKLAFLEQGPGALSYLERNTALKLTGRAYSPDYYPDVEGAKLGGRGVDPAEFDGRQLGKHFAELRDPLPGFTVLGGMMVNLYDVRHLLAITKTAASFKHGLKLLTRYALDRLSHRRGTRLVLGNALAGRLFKSMLDRGIPYWLNTPATRLLVEGGKVTGAVVTRDGAEQRIAARKGVVLATGGFPSDPERRRAIVPIEVGMWSMAPAANSGDGLGLGEAAGGAVRGENASNVFHSPVSILKRLDGTEERFPHLIWDRAKPGLMAVNGAGRRFVNESTSYHEFCLAMIESHRQVPSIPSFLVCDADFIAKWGLGLVKPGRRGLRRLRAAGYVIEAPTIETLAGKLGIDAGALKASVTGFNEAAARGVDTEFGKGGNAYNRYLGDTSRPGGNPCLGPIAVAPFYAVRVYPGDIGTAAGLMTDGRARVLDLAGKPIPGLYAVGNDMNSVMGGTYPGPGITLGPALTFGHVAAMDMAAR